MDRRVVYLDNNGTTRMADEVISFMHENDDLYGNASSMHTLGREAAAGIEWARNEVASLIDAEPEGIYFTSGASESNNTVLNIFRDVADSGDKRSRIVTTEIEHPATIETVRYLRKKGYRIDLCPVDSIGRIKLDELEALVDDDTALVSVMTGNNESGTIQPVKEAAAIAHKHGAYFHTDATQAIGKIPVSVKDIGADYLSLSAHKFYGPKGVGVLYARPGVPLADFPAHIGHAGSGIAHAGLAEYVFLRHLRQLLAHDGGIPRGSHHPHVLRRADAAEAVGRQLQQGPPAAQHVDKLFGALRCAHRPEAAAHPSGHYY